MIDLTQFPLLSTINSPHDLRQVSEQDLLLLAHEVRQYLCQALNICGGHFAANLGTVELTLALHYVFNTPEDRLIWDVGHQAYPHKILTGRRDALPTIRQLAGLAPFTNCNESPYDAFGTGHSSTSISAALGMSQAFKTLGLKHKSVAIIGDGALTAGMAFEALNHAGDLHADLLVILNDNDMSISHNVGALSNYLARLLSGKVYTAMREGSKKVLRNMPPMWELAKRAEIHMKGLVVPGALFEELGFYYVGPIDGHDLPTLLSTLQNLAQQSGPKFLHVVTRKGHGYSPAEQDPIGYHAVSPGFLEKNASAKSPAKQTYSQVFGQWLCDIAEEDPRVIGITPAMREGSGLVEFSERFPDRYYDVAIAEQHAVTFAAGLAKEGMKPVVAIYSTFLQRAYDQILHDVALQKLDVLFALDRAGLVGGDGATHNGAFDLSYLRCIPNLVIMAPADEQECREMLYTGYLYEGPACVRYPRGAGTGKIPQNQMASIAIGRAQVVREGEGIALLAFGSMVQNALPVGDALDATVVNMRFIKPLDTEILSLLAQTHRVIVTIEENAVMGGAGSAVNEYLLSQGSTCAILNLGLPDQFIEHGDSKQLLAQCGLDTDGILQSIQQRFKLTTLTASI